MMAENITKESENFLLTLWKNRIFFNNYSDRKIKFTENYMNEDRLIKVLKVIAITGIMTAAVISILKSGIIQKKINELKNKFKYKKNRDSMILIAKQINRDIKNINRRTSLRYHEKNQEKYDKLWGDDYSCN